MEANTTLFEALNASNEKNAVSELIVKNQIYKGRDGWEAEAMSRTDANGQAWQITTHKTRGGVKCSAVQGQDEGGMFSFMMFGSKKLELAFQEGQCNEKKVREVHAAGLIKFEEQMKDAPELTKPAYVLGIGQIVFTENQGTCRERVICEVIRPGKFKSVLLDASGFEHDDHLRPFSEKFGIGAYYNEGETMTAEEVSALVEKATANVKAANEAAQERERIAAEDRARKIEEGKKIISAIPSDAVSVIVAEARINTSDLMSDYHAHETEERIFLAFSTHKRDLFAEMRKAAANCPIEGINKHATPPTVNNNGHERTEENKDWWTPADEHREKYSMGAGYYLGESKYSGWVISKQGVSKESGAYGITLETLQIAAAEGRFYIDLNAKDDTGATAEPVNVPAGKIQFIDYSEKAFAVVGETKPIKDTLRELGGRFNFRLTCGAGWIFPKTRLEAVKTALSELKTAA